MQLSPASRNLAWNIMSIFCDGNTYISDSFNIHHPQYTLHKKKLTARKVQNIYRWQKELSPYYKEDLICFLRGVNVFFLPLYMRLIMKYCSAQNEL